MNRMKPQLRSKRLTDIHKNNMRPFVLTLALCIPTAAFAEEVNVENFVRAESDTMFRLNLAKFGAFVELGGDIEGMIHIADITNEKRLNHPNEVLKEGQEVKVKLLGFDDRGKVRLAMKMVDQETGEELKQAG